MCMCVCVSGRHRGLCQGKEVKMNSRLCCQTRHPRVREKLRDGRQGLAAASQSPPGCLAVVQALNICAPSVDVMTMLNLSGVVSGARSSLVTSAKQTQGQPSPTSAQKQCLALGFSGALVHMGEKYCHSKQEGRATFSLGF